METAANFVCVCLSVCLSIYLTPCDYILNVYVAQCLTWDVFELYKVLPLD